MTRRAVEHALSVPGVREAEELSPNAHFGRRDARQDVSSELRESPPIQEPLG